MYNYMRILKQTEFWDGSYVQPARSLLFAPYERMNELPLVH